MRESHAALASSTSSPSDRRAQVEVVLGPKQALPRVFSPLLPPRAVRAALHGLPGEGIESLRASFSVGLVSGEHRIPLSSRAHVRVSVEPGTQARGEIVASPAGADPRTIVKNLAIELSDPLVFHDILPVLLELPMLFEDHAFGRVLARLLGLDLEWAGATVVERLEAARAAAGKAARVALERIDARPRAHKGVWLLELHFTGTAYIGGTYPFRFEGWRLPHVIIPAVHAHLARLLSEAPLASAELRTTAAVDLLDAVLGLLGEASGRLEARARIPETALRALLHDRSDLRAHVRVEGPLDVTCAFSARASDDRLELSMNELSLESDGRRLGAEARVSLARSERPGRASERPGGLAATDGTDGPRMAEALRHVARNGTVPPGWVFDANAKIAPDSCLSKLIVEGDIRHDLLLGGFDAKTVLEDLQLSGAADLRVDADGSPSIVTDLEFGCRVTTLDPTSLSDGITRVGVTRSSATLRGRLRADTDTPLDVSIHGEATACLEGRATVTPIPELSIETGEVTFTFDTSARFDVVARVRRADGGARVRRADGPDAGDHHTLDGSGSTFAATVHHGELRLSGRTLELPSDTEVSFAMREGVIDASGLGRSVAEVAWDMKGRSPVLSWGGPRAGATETRSTELFVESLRKRAFVVSLAATGGLTVTGEGGDKYGPRFFNALLNPGADLDALVEVLDDDESIERILAALELFSEGARDLGGKVRDLAKKARSALDAEGVKKPGDGVPAPVLARVLSRILCGTPELEARILPLVLRVVAGDGLDVLATKHLLDEQLGDHPYAFELDRGLRWIAHLLSPTDPLAPLEPVALGAVELADEHRKSLVGIPSAREIYEGIAAGYPAENAGEDFPARVAWVAPYLQLEQLDWILPRIGAWPREARRRILHARELKRRVRMISESYGGVAFFPQAIAITFFLGETLAMGGAWTPPPSAADDPALDRLPIGSLFGPEDVAVLLQASLASPLQGRTEQLNERMLLDHTFAQPPAFLLGVLVELSGRSSYVLAGVLNALLNNDQDCVRAPLDLVGEISRRLGFELPRLSDYIAGGRWAKLSYFEALDRAAQQVLAAADPWLATKCHLQIRRPPPSESPVVPAVAVDPAPERAVERADHTRDPADYARAFDVCKTLLRRDRQAFQRPWMRDFWLRNYEALMVHSVVRSVQGDVDASRRWLERRTARAIPEREQELLELVVDYLYYRPEDRARLKADPLVRLLIDPPDARYDFTVVSAMGVVTEGARGRELEETYRRLEERRGIKVVRADTATGRSLEYNAVQVEDAVRSVEGPWGIIGYSQGCANALAAEARMLGGTPEQQELVSRLRCRNLLFGAFNGSAHGTCSNAKFLRGIVEGEQFLKHYQGVLSREAVTHAQRALRMMFDSRPFVHGTLGSLSLAHEGVRFLQREGQFKPDVPTSTIRGVVEPETLPEELEWMSNLLTRQIESPEHDTQVSAHEAVGHPVWVQNEQAEVLRRCSLDGAIQRCCHWSPLRYETEFLETERDRRLAIYDIPKDRHVFPWIDVNARFGIIDVRG
ncbi:MAG: hypothetical protein HYV09_25135 [Deltaproteobacteria bacterium]|nr:hypothetical protein [Deltaproteobacteria bacterium]